jgi:hypothetical protein
MESLLRNFPCKPREDIPYWQNSILVQSSDSMKINLKPTKEKDHGACGLKGFLNAVPLPDLPLIFNRHFKSYAEAQKALIFFICFEPNLRLL